MLSDEEIRHQEIDQEMSQFANCEREDSVYEQWLYSTDIGEDATHDHDQDN